MSHSDHHGHDHPTGHSHAHGHDHSRQRLAWALAINFAFLIVEYIGGVLSGSLALLSDAGHMLTDVAALGLALAAAQLARRPPGPRATYGLLRAEVLGAFFNGVSLVLVVGLIFWEALRRIGRPVHIDGPLMLIVAALGLAANLGSALILLPQRKDNINVRGAFIHLAADALGSAGAVAAGVVIWTTGWTPIDLLTSGFIGLLILYGSLGLLRETFRILLNATPPELDYAQVKQALERVAHFTEIRDLHIWSLATGTNILTAHVRLEAGCSDSRHWQECLHEAQGMLRRDFHIRHATLQLEPPSLPPTEHEH